MQTVRLLGTGSAQWNWNAPACTGTAEKPCPGSASGTITYQTNGFPYEGEEKVSLQPLDPTGKGANAEQHTLLLDGRVPTVKREGQLAEVAGEDLSLPTYALKATATDGTSAEPNSGVKEISFYLDESKTPLASKSQTCATRNCEMSFEYTLRLEELAPGHHTLRTVAEDMVGNKAEANSIGFDYVPPTGMKDEFLLQHVPLPDGEDHSGEAEPHGPEIAVNVATGNLVFHQRDVHAPTAHASLDLERSYNSQQPEAQDGQWGRGWSLVQAPELTQSAAEVSNHEATLVGTSTGAVTSSVPAPASEGAEALSATLHATVRKAGAGYEVGYETKGETQVFGPGGKIEETVVGAVEPPSEPNLNSTPTYVSSFGASGTGNGQFSHPAGIAIDAEGSLWVIDENNNRVEKFNQAGEFQLKFGSSGTGNGQFNRPTAVALDPEGNVWVVDAGNHRVQEFNAKGEFVQKFGTAGSGNGQLSTAEGIAIDPAGDVFVADTYNARIEEFNAKGEFLATIGTKGSGAGQLIEPTDVALGKAGSLWVTDWSNNKVVEFNANGVYVRQFGSSGTGNGQFAHPDVLTVDLMGDVWIGDQNNARVQRFSEEGTYRAKFGTKGSGAGQFSFGYPMGIDVDQNGNIWVADTANNRVQKWAIPGFDPSYGAPESAPPAVEFDYSGKNLAEMALDEVGSEEDLSLQLAISGAGQATEAAGEGEVDGEALGDSTYTYEGNKLMSAEDENGDKTPYGYDAGGRLTSIKLPNDTTATMEYDSLDRATLVTVDPAGPEGAKTIHFFYKDQPRETTVWGTEPEAVYQIGVKGGVFHWQNTGTPPTLRPLSGSLVPYFNKAEAVSNKDQTLTVEAESSNEIASMRVIVGGNAVVEEKTCKDESIPPKHNCDKPESMVWITNPSEHAAGRLNAEVVATDFLGHSTAEHFFVTMPQQPPPDLSAPEKPDFKSIKLFREEYGLDREHTYTEAQLNKLILELLYEWETQQPAAMPGVAEWGSPLRQPEMEELEERERFLEQAAEIIPAWAEVHAPNTYGGYYVNQREGGKIYVGFTSEQGTLVAQLKASAGLIGSSHVYEFPIPPTVSLAFLEASEETIAGVIEADSSALSATTSIATQQETGKVEVVATNPSLVASYLAGHLGSMAHVEVVAEEDEGGPTGRFKFKGGVDAGDELESGPVFCEGGAFGCINVCTAGFSARAPDPDTGGPPWRYFVLTAGHCFAKGAQARRTGDKLHQAKPSVVGEITRNSWERPGDGLKVDAEAISVDPGLASGYVFRGPSGRSPERFPVRSLGRARVGMTLCWSGLKGGKNCGPAKRWFRRRYDGHFARMLEVAAGSAEGDSGSPVWARGNKTAVALAVYHYGRHCTTIGDPKTGPRYCKHTGVAPLLSRENVGVPAGILPELGVSLLVN